MRILDKIIRVICYIVLIAALIITIFPIVYAIAGSFKTNTELLMGSTIFPKHPTVENYVYAFQSESFNVPRMMMNSIMYTVYNVVVMILISSMAGYVFARGKFPGRNLIFICFSSLLFVKTGGLTIYPQFQILQALHLNKGLYALMFLGLFSIPVVNIYLIRGFIDALPKELDESARIDGCSFAGTFFRIIMPLLKPVLATIGILTFNTSWNDYITPNIFTATKPEQQTLIVGLMALKNSDGAATNWNLMLAGSVIALIPVLVAYAFGNQYFVSGLASGAVKG